MDRGTDREEEIKMTGRGWGETGQWRGRKKKRLSLRLCCLLILWPWLEPWTWEKWRNNIAYCISRWALRPNPGFISAPLLLVVWAWDYPSWASFFTILMGMLELSWDLDKIMYVKHLSKYLAHINLFNILAVVIIYLQGRLMECTQDIFYLYLVYLISHIFLCLCHTYSSSLIYNDSSWESYYLTLFVLRLLWTNVFKEREMNQIVIHCCFLHK